VGVSPNASVKSGLIEKLRAIEPHGCVSIVDNHTWNGITCDALVELVLGIILENELIPGIFHLGTLSSISREQLFHNILDSLGRTDVRVNVVHQNPVRNLSLDSRKKAIVASWWAKTKYLETPELEDLWRDMKLN
jgi:hypothetical protein